MTYSQLRQQIEDFQPYNQQEAGDRLTLLRYFDCFDNLLTRENPFAHLTASALVLNPARDRTLLAYHNIYQSWAWLGGHADGDPDLLEVARREVLEESGVPTRPITTHILAVDILPVWGHVKRGEYLSSHQHLSLCYLLEGDDTLPVQVRPQENSAVQWFPLREMVSRSTEPEMKPVYEKLLAKAQLYR